MTYLNWLIALSIAFAILERMAPRRRDQPAWRQGLLRDLGFLILNGHVFALLVGSAATAIATATRSTLGGADWNFQLAGDWPLPVQFFVFFVVSDFIQWLGHNALHRVPWLWTFHKVHHSIHQMDWAGNFRYHWFENVVYRCIQFVPLAALGASYEATFWVYVFGTAWGHFNHANLAVGIGPLGYVFNSPAMHLWHHDASAEGGQVKNLGIVLSVWDWLFGTAYWPRDRAPTRLGYSGDAEMPADLAQELLWPAPKLWSTR